VSYQVTGTRARANARTYVVTGSRARAAASRSYQITGTRARATLPIGTNSYVISGTRARATQPVDLSSAVEPYTSIDLGAGSWVQLSGPPITLTGLTNTFKTPALPDPTTLQFQQGATVVTIAVFPHTIYLAKAGADQPLFGVTDPALL
jgi:hypothetical protein